jgi:outer membrane receptor protein involved in Fe transport
LFKRDINHGNVYIYSYINALRNVTLTAGASGDFFKTLDNAAKSRNQFNPKFGITWNPVPDTTLRPAGFRTLKRTLISNATLEPTQVAGFNQFFDDASGTVSWRYGGAIDQKFTKNIFGGLEFSKRDLTVPYVDPTFTTQEVDWKEYLARTYLFWTPHPWVALRAEYQFERFMRDKEFVFDVRKVNTHRVPLGISFFHPSGFSAGLSTTYLNQHGKFEPGAPGVFVTGKDDFWLVDAAISYRLPKRYGQITVGANNLFDKSFKFRDTDPVSPSIQPRRFIFARLTLAFP